MFKADIHCHTTCSDGTFTPQEIVEEAVRRGLQGLSITDHDTTSAYPEALEFAKKAGIEMITGVEFSAMQMGTSVHILAYGFDASDANILSFCSQHQERRLQRNREILHKLNALGMPIQEEEIHSSTHTVGRPHIAEMLIKKGYVKSFDDAFRKYLGDHKSCYVQGHFFSVEETLEIIHQAGALAVIAHPHLFDDHKIMQELAAMPFDGIEGFYARFPLKKCAPWITFGKERGWIVTGGSDFHGAVKPQTALGSSYVNRETFDRVGA